MVPRLEVGVEDKSTGSEVHEGKGKSWGGGGDIEDSEGLGFPNIADSIEYSKLAASEPKVKVGSKEEVRMDSFCGNDSAERKKIKLDMKMTNSASPNRYTN